MVHEFRKPETFEVNGIRENQQCICAQDSRRRDEIFNITICFLLYPAVDLSSCLLNISDVVNLSEFCVVKLTSSFFVGLQDFKAFLKEQSVCCAELLF